VDKINPSERYQDDEIDLYDLWLVLKKRKITILFIILVSLGIAIAYAVLAPKVYRVSNALVLNQVQHKDEIELIKRGEIVAAVADLDMLLNLNKEKVAHLLSMQVKDLNGIGNIKASEGKGSSVVLVDIEAFNSSAGIALMEALPGYIQSTPSIASKLDMQTALMEKNREDLKAIIDNPTKDLKLSSNTVVYVPSIDLYALREKYNHLNMIMEKIEKGEIVSLTWKTEPSLKPFKPNIKLAILLSIVMGCFLGALAAFFIEWLSNARRTRGLE
jgi:capsular polysaccharide biosynthesis protein